MFKLQTFHPFYHTTSNTELSHIKHLYSYPGIDIFERHLDDIAQSFEFVSAQDWLNGKRKVNGKSTSILSFDDGLKECSQFIAPILKRKGVPAVFFVNPGFVDSDQIFFRYKVSRLVEEFQSRPSSDPLVNNAFEILKLSNHIGDDPSEILMAMSEKEEGLLDELMQVLGIRLANANVYMSKKDISQLAKEGFEIGGHSMDHPRFVEISREEQLRQIQESVEYCINEFNQTLKLFAFPYYDFDMSRSLFSVMFDELKIDLSFGTSGPKDDFDERIIQRTPMEGVGMDVSSHLNHLALKSALKRLVGLGRIKRKD